MSPTVARESAGSGFDPPGAHHHRRSLRCTNRRLKIQGRRCRGDLRAEVPDRRRRSILSLVAAPRSRRWRATGATSGGPSVPRLARNTLGHRHQRSASRRSCAVGGARITATGQADKVIHRNDTDPSRSPAQPPRPRDPTTSSAAPSEALSSTDCANPGTWLLMISTSEATTSVDRRMLCHSRSACAFALEPSGRSRPCAA